MPAGQCSVNAGADKIGVGDQALDAGHLFKKEQEGAGIEHLEQMPGIAGQPVRIVLGFEPFLRGIETAFCIGQTGQVFGDPCDHLRGQEVVDADMVVRLSALVGFGIARAQFLGGGGLNGQLSRVKRQN